MNNKIDSNNWKDFLWVHTGEGGHRREGYTPSVFSGMTRIERERAKDILVTDYEKGDVFSLDGLVFLDPKYAKCFITCTLTQDDLNIVEKITLSAKLTKLTKCFKISEFIIDHLEDEDRTVRVVATQKLEEISNFVPNEANRKIAESIISEGDELIRFWKARLLIRSNNIKDLKSLPRVCMTTTLADDRIKILKAFNLL